MFLLKCVLLFSWRGGLGVDPSGRLPSSTAPTLLAAAQRARHVHGDILTVMFLCVSVMDLVTTEREMIREIKEKPSYSVLNFDTELNRLTRRRLASSQTETSSLSSSSNRPRTVTRRRPTSFLTEMSSIWRRPFPLRGSVVPVKFLG